MYYNKVNKNVANAESLNLLLLFGSCNTFVREFVTLSSTVFVATDGVKS